MSPRAFDRLALDEQTAALDCMKVIAEGREIEDWEFQTRLGITRAQLEKVITAWPEIDDSRESSEEFLAINNSFNEVCHGIAIPEAEWGKYFSQPREKVKKAYTHWLQLRGATRGGIR
jgi:hypothetical protein